MADPSTAATRPQEDLFSSVRGRFATIVGLAFLGGVAICAPMIGIVELARTLSPALTGEPVDARHAWMVVLFCVAAMAAGFLLPSISLGIGHSADNDMQYDLRKRIVVKLQRLPLGWFDERTSGAVKKVAENDVNALHQLVAHALHDFTQAVTVPIVCIAYLFTIDWRLALAALVPVVVCIGLWAKMMAGSGEQYAEYDAALVRLNAATIEYVQGIGVVKMFGNGGSAYARFSDETGKFVRFYGNWMRQCARDSQAPELSTSPIAALLYLSTVGAALVHFGSATPMDVLPALLLGINIAGPLYSIGSTGQFIRNALKARESLEEFFAQDEIPRPLDPRMPSGHTVALEDVEFSYEAGHPVIDHITAQCPPGTVTALVGASGSGKSTLGRLIPRFYDVEDGEVSIGGVDVRDQDWTELYGQVGFVFQDPYLMRTSVRENIRLANPQASDAEVESAARAAQIHDRIMRLPRGCESVIGEDAHLSGGEAQRLTIARALVTDAPVLVLDEATAFADPDSEAAIQDALNVLARGRTLIVIAHRLHTITGADQILVMEGGRVIERGTHADLVAQSGHYAEMWRKYETTTSADAVESGSPALVNKEMTR